MKYTVKANGKAHECENREAAEQVVKVLRRFFEAWEIEVEVTEVRVLDTNEFIHGDGFYR